MDIFIRRTTSILAFTFALTFFFSCSPSYEEKQGMKEKAKKQAIERQQAEEKQLLSQLIGNYEIVHFPPSDFTDGIFTYELQRYFESQSNNYIAFRGYIEDLEKLNGNIYIEFSCVISNEIVIDPAIIAFRLEVSGVYSI